MQSSRKRSFECNLSPNTAKRHRNPAPRGPLTYRPRFNPAAADDPGFGIEAEAEMMGFWRPPWALRGEEGGGV